MTIRRAGAHDAGDVTLLLRQVHKVHADGRPDIFKPGGIKYTDEELKELLCDPERPVFVYEEEGKVLGYVFCIFEYQKETSSVREIKTLYIDDLCVDEAARGRGIGKALYERACEEAKETGCYRVTLHVWELNPGAGAFYEKLGMKTLMRTMEHIL